MGTLNPIESQQPAAAQRAAFEARYGEGAFDQLLGLLGQPCTSFAQIAGHFGVTRERVRQWQGQWLPDAPAGLQRRRLCADYQQKRRLLLDPLFRAFHRHARASIGTQRIHPLRSRRGYQARTVLIDHVVVALRNAVGTPPRYRGRADFIYFRLADDEFVFVAGTADIATQPRNTFAALDTLSGVAARESLMPRSARLQPGDEKEQSL